MIDQLKKERDKFLDISNTLKGELNYVKKTEGPRSETNAKDIGKLIQSSIAIQYSYVFL